MLGKCVSLQSIAQARGLLTTFMCYKAYAWVCCCNCRFSYKNLGVISLGDSKALQEVSGALYAFNVPHLAVTRGSGGVEEGPDDDLLAKYDNLLTTVPDRAGQIKVRANLHALFDNNS